MVEAHTCRYQGRDFTHLIFNAGGGLMSVLIMDLPTGGGPGNDPIDRISIEGYQIARFDVAEKAVFVISDLSEEENFAAAKIVENPLRDGILNNAQAELHPFRRFLPAFQFHSIGKSTVARGVLF